MTPERELDPPVNDETQCFICEDWFKESETKLIDTKEVYGNVCTDCEGKQDCEKTNTWKKDGLQWSFTTKKKKDDN